jgi:uncharacterized phage protein (TIGR02218 family)
MKQLASELKNHLEDDVTTLCNAWRVTRRDGIVLGFTDHDNSLEFDNTIFVPESGFLPSAARSELGLNVDDGEVAGAFSSDAITESDLAEGRYDNALVEVFLINWQDPNSFLKMRTQEIGEVSFGDHIFRAELRSLAHKLDQPQGRVYSRRCSADLGDGACKINLDTAQYKASGSVVSASDDRSCVISGLSAFDAGWFRHGLLTWQSGQNANLSVEVLDHSADDNQITMKFFSPLAHVPQIGDTFTVTAGCSKHFDTCRHKFANILNFQGFPHLPGSDFAYGYADGATVHDGRPLVTS